MSIGIEVIEQVAERSEIVISSGTVHTIIYGDKADITARKDKFRITSHLQVIPAEPAHILDDKIFHQTLLYKGESLLYTGAVKICPGITVIGQDANVLKTMLLCISGEDGPLVCNAVALAVQ